MLLKASVSFTNFHNKVLKFSSDVHYIYEGLHRVNGAKCVDCVQVKYKFS